MSKLTTALLIGSLAVNVFAVGYLARDVGKEPSWRHERSEPRSDRQRVSRADPWRMLRSIEALPDERRDELRADIRERLPDVRTQWKDARAARAAAFQAMQAEPFDADAARAALERAGALQAEQWKTISDVLVDTLNEMTPEERAVVRTAMTERHKRFHGRHHRRDWKHDERDESHGEKAPAPDDAPPPPDGR